MRSKTKGAAAAAAVAAAGAFGWRALSRPVQKIYPATRYRIGTMRVGDVMFEVTHAYLRQGHLVMRCTANTTQAGQVRGRATVYGTDGTVAFRGHHDTDMGLKTIGQVWTMVFSIWLMAGRETEPGFDEDTEMRYNPETGNVEPLKDLVSRDESEYPGADL